MAISPVSFGSNPTQTTAKKKMSPVKKGAIIGGGIGTALAGASLTAVNYIAKSADTSLKGFIKETYGGLGKYAAIMTAAVAGYTLIGAGIGKLVKNHQAKKAEKAAALDQQA